MLWHILFLLGMMVLNSAGGARILVLFAFPAKSHIGAFMPLIDELANRGHELTVVSAFPRKTPLPNYSEIIFSDTFKDAKEKQNINMFDLQNAYFVPMLFFFFYVCRQNCENFLQDPNIQKLIHSEDQHFDLVMYEPFFTECTYGLVHKFKAPSIQIFPNTIIPLMGNSVGNPSTVSYIADSMVENHMTGVWDRLLNFLRVGYAYVFRKLYIIPQMDALVRKYYPDPTTPSIEEIESNTSFLFLHSHPLIHHPRPLTPNTIEIAGLHLKGTKKLPQDLQRFLDDAPHGVIYFSLGSNINSVDMPETMRNAILKTFSHLKQKVLWKWEDDTLPGQPSNVLLGKWLPQHDILAHPNVKLFITHGGLMSLQETIHFGVPLVAIPVMSEQKANALRAQEMGFGVVVTIPNITEESLSWAIKEVLHDPRYHKKVKETSKIFNDQPQQAMERAIFWTEFAIRHKGAPHLKSAGLKLNFFQYYLIDVIAVLLLLGLTFTALFFLCMPVICRRLCLKKKSNSTQSSKKHN